MSKSQRKNIIIHKFLKNFFLALLLFNLVIICFLTPVFSNTYDLRKYDTRFEKFGVYDVFEKEVALDKAQNIISFFESKEDLDREFFPENENKHLLDVKIILQKSNMIFFLSLFLILVSIISLVYLDRKKCFEDFSNMIFLSGVILLSFVLILLLIYLIFGFENIFEIFHKLVFTGNYAFDKLSNIKKLLPDAFFNDVFYSILRDIVSQGMLFIILGYIARISFKK